MCTNTIHRMTQNGRRTWQRWRTIWSAHLHIKQRQTDRTKPIERRLLMSCMSCCWLSWSSINEFWALLCALCVRQNRYCNESQWLTQVTSILPIDSVAAFTKTLHRCFCSSGTEDVCFTVYLATEDRWATEQNHSSLLQLFHLSSIYIGINSIYLSRTLWNYQHCNNANQRFSTFKNFCNRPINCTRKLFHSLTRSSATAEIARVGVIVLFESLNVTDVGIGTNRKPIWYMRLPIS